MAQLEKTRHVALQLPKDGSAESWLYVTPNTIEMHRGHRGIVGGSSGPGRRESWDRCSHAPCIGKADGPGGVCLAHRDDRREHIRTLISQNKPIYFSGIRVTRAIVNDLIECLDDGKTVPVEVYFSAAEFGERIEIEEIRFRRRIYLGQAVFEQRLSFDRCVFEGALVADHATLREGGGYLLAQQCSFKGPVEVSYANTGGTAAFEFQGCSFDDRLTADGLDGDLIMGVRLDMARKKPAAICNGDVRIRQAKMRRLILNDVSFSHGLDLSDTTAEYMSGLNLRARVAHRLGPLHFKSAVRLRGAVFESPAAITIEAEEAGFHEGPGFDPTAPPQVVELADVVFRMGGALKLTNVEDLNLDRVTTGGHLAIVADRNRSAFPMRITLENTDVTNMSLANADVSRTSFSGVPGLENLIIDPTVRFPRAPRRWWMTRRNCTADEYAWRSRSGRRDADRWTLEGAFDRSDLTEDLIEEQVFILPEVTASEVAWTYRRLRQGFEDRANAPGAADFYYGEMEMRRHDHTAPLAERVLLWLYWAVSGYGLRGLRSGLWLLAAIGLGASGLMLTGISSGISEAARSAIWAVIPGGQIELRPDSAADQIPGAGSWILLGLRILGPVLIGLALLALRGRVKR